MAIPSRTARPGTYFITSATHNRRRHFQVEANAQLFVETLEHYRESYLLHAYVVMPDHIHLLMTLTTVALERAMQLIKGGYSHRIGSKMSVWQRGSTDHRIRDAEDFNVRLQYIHRNPVEARLCDKAEGYGFSSANAKVRLDEYLSG
ncbi:MAG: transposase [Acidobacteria bacterium]|nr:transposase [Acidobacteriota bacterium]